MSFILDALKKVDRDGNEPPSVRARRAFAVSRARQVRQNALWMSLIALVSAGVTAVLVVYLPTTSDASKDGNASAAASSGIGLGICETFCQCPTP